MLSWCVCVSLRMPFCARACVGSASACVCCCSASACTVFPRLRVIFFLHIQRWRPPKRSPSVYARPEPCPPVVAVPQRRPGPMPRRPPQLCWPTGSSDGARRTREGESPHLPLRIIETFGGVASARTGPECSGLVSPARRPSQRRRGSRGQYGGPGGGGKGVSQRYQRMHLSAVAASRTGQPLQKAPCAGVPQHHRIGGLVGTDDRLLVPRKDSGGVDLLHRVRALAVRGSHTHLAATTSAGPCACVRRVHPLRWPRCLRTCWRAPLYSWTMPPGRRPRTARGRPLMHSGGPG